MKIRNKKITSLILALVMILSSFVMFSCGGDNTPSALTLGEHKVTEAMYSYWASSYKGTVLYTYEDVVNSEEYWNGEIEKGKSVAEYFDEITLEAVKTNLVTSHLFDEYGLSFSEKETKAIDDYIKDLIAERADGSKNMMNTILGEYGVNTKILKSIYLEEEKGAKVFNALYGEGGQRELSDEDYEKFYMDNFVRVQMIYIENINTYKTDEKGNRVTDETGYYVIEELKGDAKKEKDKAVKTVKDALKKGEDFDKLYEKYSELKDYKNGHYYSASSAYGDVFYYRLVSEVMGLKTGEWTALESEMGTCIVKKLELDEGAWNNKDNEAFFGDFETTVQETEYKKLVEKYFADIIVDEEIINKYSISKVTPVYF